MSNQLMTLPAIIIQQKAKLAQLSEEYNIFNEYNVEIGTVKPVAQSVGQKILQILTLNDPMIRKRFVVMDDAGVAVINLDKPKHFAKPKVRILNNSGNLLATVALNPDLTKNSHFAITDAQGSLLGKLQAQDILDKSLILTDTSGNEWARVEKQPVNLAKELTHAERYTVHINPTLSADQRKVAIGAAISVDIVIFPTVRYT